MIEHFGGSKHKNEKQKWHNSSDPNTTEHLEVLQQRLLLDQAKQLLPQSEDVVKTVETVRNPDEYVDRLFGVEVIPSRHSLEPLINWIREEPGLERERAAIVEKNLLAHLERGDSLNVAGAVLLPEIENAQGSSLFDPTLTVAMFEHLSAEGFSDHFTALSNLNDKEGNVIVHKTLDLCEMFWESLHNITPDNEEYYDLQRIRDEWVGLPTFTQSAAALIEQSEANARNYLLQKHMQDALESIELWTDKPGALSGTPGGARDEKIYTFRRLRESFDLRRKLDMWEGYVIGNLVVPIAPGYVAMYDRLGRAEKIFRTDKQRNEQDIEREDHALSDANDNKSHDWVYDSLNIPPRQGEDASTGLQKLRSIWNLNKDLKAGNESFYFDLGRIDMQHLHPMVMGDLLHRNFEYLKGQHGSLNNQSPIESEKMRSLLFPVSSMGGASEEYLYKLFSSLGMRKKIEDEFNIKLEELSFPAQAQFLTLLNTRTENDFEDVKAFSGKFGIDGLCTFLVTAGDEQLRKKVFDFAREMPKEEAQKVFEAYGKLVGSIDGVGDYLREQFGQENAAAVEMIVEKQLSRARGLLLKAHDFKDSPERLLGLVESVQADTQLFLDSCKILRQQGALSLEDVRDTTLEVVAGNTISEQDASVIRGVQETYYAGKYPETLMGALRAGLDRALASSDTRFYLYRKNGEILTFVRFDDLSASNDNGKHMGSFMTNPVYEGGALGQALLETALQKETKSGPLYAECDPSLVSFYEKFGFRLLRSYKDDHGVDTCDIVLEPESEELRLAA